MIDAAPRRPRDWRPAFVVSLVTVALSLALLAIVIFAKTTDDTASAGTSGTAGVAPASAVATTGATRLTYAGPLPAALQSAGLELAAAGARPDIRLQEVETGGVVTRYFVPVAAIGTGMTGVSTESFRRLAGGSIPTWVDAGGIGGRVVFAGAGPEEDQALQARFAAVAPTKTYATYDDLLAAMTLDSGMIAIVPIEHVRVSVTALAVDGVDLVRGRGDPAAWPFAARLAVTAETARGNGALAAISSSAAAALPVVTTIVATGDILQSRCTLTKIRATGDWASPLRSPVGVYLKAADLALASLDGSIQDIGEPYGCVATTNLTSPPQVLEALTIAGIDEVTVATNHIFDCGQVFCGNRAFLRTLELLSLAGIKTVGGGKTLEEALAPAIFEVHGVRIGVLGFDDIAAEDLEATATAPGTAPLDDSYADEKSALPHEPAFYKPADMLDLTRMTERIRQLRQQVDIVVVQVQSGYEDTHDASPRSIKALRAAADAGADLVVGNQGHWVQPVEVRGKTFVAYALGNFIFDQVHTLEHTQGYLLEATLLGKQLVNVRLVPYAIAEQYRPAFVQGETRLRVLSDVFTASKLLPPSR